MALMPRNSWFSRNGHYCNQSMVPSSPCWNDVRPWPSPAWRPLPWFEENRREFLEMEQRFAKFMSQIDERFAGMLGLIDVETDPRVPILVQHDGLDEAQVVSHNKDKKHFKIEINVQDFKPEEVTVKVAHGKVQVHAKRETQNEDTGMYAYTFREFRRTFALPKGLRTEDVESSLAEDGILTIEGSRCDIPAITEIPIDVVHEK